MSKITVVTYVHAAHKSWIGFWAEQISQQEFKNFDILFIAHNWGNESHNQMSSNLDEFSELLRNSPIWNMPNLVRFESYWSPPVIGEVINEACHLVETEYFAHWDVDDIIHPKRLLLQSQFLDAHPDIDFLNARAQGFYGEPPPWPDNLCQPIEEVDPILRWLKSPELCTHEQIRACLNRNLNPLSHGLMVYRPEVLRQLGGFSKSDVKLDGKSPDEMTWRKAIDAGKIFNRLPELLMYWRLDSSAIRYV